MSPANTFLLILFYCPLSLSYGPNLKFKFYFHPDRHLNFQQTVNKYGYPFEEHIITTKDNYILTTFRIPHGRYSNSTNKSPVLLVHGMGGCGDNFIVAGPYKSLAYYLADNGFDVWVMNSRGTRTSRKHKFYKHSDREFWEYSWHEIAVVDIATNIDYILRETNESSLFYVGHSQGSTCYFVLTSCLPEYNEKIKLAVQLAAPVLLEHINLPLTRISSKFHFVLTWLKRIININYLIHQDFVNVIIQELCSEITILGDFCRQIIYFGAYSETIDKKILQILYGKSPAGQSIDQIVHYGQIVDTGRFAWFDYGTKKNLQLYKSRLPPLYNISKCTAPVAFFYSVEDIVSPVQQIEHFEKILTNIFAKVVVPKYQHVDFIFARNVDEMVNKPMVDMFKSIDSKS